MGMFIRTANQKQLHTGTVAQTAANIPQPNHTPSGPD